MRRMVPIVVVLLVIGCRPPAPPPPAPPNPQAEDALIELTNKVRSEKALKPLNKNEQLSIAARKYAQLMASRDTLSHNLDGSIGSRISREGYQWRSCGENIAWSYPTVQKVMDGWLSSPGHRNNIMSKDFQDIGVGLAYNQRKEAYFCQVFGRD